MAAEGAILNEMLEIVKKRAALRPSDTMVGSDGYEVSDGPSSSTSSFPSRTVSRGFLHHIRTYLEITDNSVVESEASRSFIRRRIVRCCTYLSAVLAMIVLVFSIFFPSFDCLES